MDKTVYVFFWALLVNAVFLIFSLVRIFAVKQIHYGLLDLINPSFYLKHPIFIVLAIIGPITFISDLMVFSAAGEITVERMGVFGLISLNVVTVVFGFLQFFMVNVLFKSETIPSKVWILLVFWFVLIAAGTITGVAILKELRGPTG